MFKIPSSSKTIPLESVTTIESQAALPEVVTYRLIFDDFEDLDCCDFLFGLDRGEISKYYEHPRNVLHLQKDMLDLIFEAGWILIPTQATLELIHAYHLNNITTEYDNRNCVYESFPEDSYSFIIVPIQHTSPIYYRDPDSLSVRRCDYPYADLPLVTSTANPYAIYAVFRDVMRKMMKLELPPKMQNLHDFIHMQWTVKPPIEFFRRGRDLDSERGPPPWIFMSELDAEDASGSTNGERPLAHWRLHPSLQEEDERRRITRWLRGCQPSTMYQKADNDLRLGSYARERARPVNEALAKDPLWASFVKDGRRRWDKQRGGARCNERERSIVKRKRMEQMTGPARTRLKI